MVSLDWVILVVLIFSLLINVILLGYVAFATRFERTVSRKH